MRRCVTAAEGNKESGVQEERRSTCGRRCCVQTFLILCIQHLCAVRSESPRNDDNTWLWHPSLDLGVRSWILDEPRPVAEILDNQDLLHDGRSFRTVTEIKVPLGKRP